jgi:hypothetical protein
MTSFMRNSDCYCADRIDSGERLRIGSAAAFRCPQWNGR